MALPKYAGCHKFSTKSNEKIKVVKKKAEETNRQTNIQTKSHIQKDFCHIQVKVHPANGVVLITGRDVQYLHFLQQVLVENESVCTKH